MLVCVFLEIGGDGGEIGGGAVVANHKGSDGGFSDGDVGTDGVGMVGDANDAEHVCVGFGDACQAGVNWRFLVLMV